jgi:hypothetical protein
VVVFIFIFVGVVVFLFSIFGLYYFILFVLVVI